MQQVRNILVLGSGLMTDSIVSVLLSNPKNRIHIASNILADAKTMAEKKGLDRCTYSQVDVQNKSSLMPIIHICDIVISYIPAFLHHHVAKLCLELNKNMVNASYISPDMKAFDQQAKEKGLVFLCQLGLDPGIDHLATMKIKDEVYEKGGKIVEYESWCGGLPAPNCCDNPLGYKFTWSPIGAFRALKNKALYIDHSKQVSIEAADLLYTAKTIEINNALSLQGYPNRDSVSYKDVYGLKDVTKILRGTLRYSGFCQLINAFKEIGLFDETKVSGSNWVQYISRLVQSQKGATLEERVANRTVSNVKHYQSASLEVNERRIRKVLSNFKYFGLTRPEKFAKPDGSNLQNLVQLLMPKLSLKPGQIDMIAMQHRFIIELNGKRYLRKSSMIEIGEKKGFSAMSLTVATPTAIGAELILEGKVSERGVIRPVYKDIYLPCLQRLQKCGIRLVEEEEEL